MSDSPVSEDTPNVWRSRAARLATWVLTFGCFYLVYSRMEVAAAREGLTAIEYLVNFFAAADWVAWLMLMIPYSLFFYMVDSHATWRLIRWFNAPSIKLTNIMPIRASAYILSLVNEQVGKGAMSLYLLRRYDVPVWQAVSSMIMLGMVEIYQLLLFSAVGVLLYYDLVVQASTSYPLPTIMLSVYALAFIYFPIHVLYFRGAFLKDSKLRQRQLLHAFRQAELKHYVMLLLFKIPNMLGAMVVYTIALSLFKVDVEFGQMVAFLPVIFLAAALPLPFHAGALVLWSALFPQFPEVGVFSLVMHTFFVIFNALIGLAFLPRANKELFVER
tara:strand:+ start:86315 stop:87304 length:990 start_codon:yes stop_codon:yes gene_type:complete